MKKIISIIILCLSFTGLSACDENPAREYGRALTGSMERADATADMANLEALKKSIAAHQASYGTYPESLDEIAQAMGLDPSRYDYDPATGQVALK